MKLSERRLRSLLPSLSATPEEIAGRLREGGIQVSGIVQLKELLEAVVVARVESVTRHPNADRLKICVVHDGGEAPLQIITGASNVEAGAYYPLFRSGTTLPNGTRIKRGKLRGEVSEGMLASPDELELGAGHEGLMTLAGELTPGTPLPEVIDVEGVVFTIDGDPEEDEIIRGLTRGGA